MIRRLPPSLTKEDLEEQLQPLPELDYLEFFSSDTRFVDAVFYKRIRKSESRKKSIYGWSMCLFICSLFPHLFARAYLNFKYQDDIVLFRDRFDGYVFIDSRGLDFTWHYFSSIHCLLTNQSMLVNVSYSKNFFYIYYRTRISSHCWVCSIPESC